MRRIAVLAAACAVLAGLIAPGASANTAVVVEPVAFTVQNPLEPGVDRVVRGSIYRPRGGCSSSAMLLMHGLSYGKWGWDFPVQTETYSVARSLAARGIAAIAVDELGYGSSDKPNGYTLTVQSYAAMTHQMIGQLRAGSYRAPTPLAFGSVGLMGHSAGTEISELTAGIFGGVDLLVATAYTHFPSQRIVGDFVTGDSVRAAQGDYEYFGENPRQRAEYMYHLPSADPEIVRADTRLANLTPSGEVWSIGNQPSRWVVANIDVPVLLVLAEHDILFPPHNEVEPSGPSYESMERSLFASSPDVSSMVVPDAGHSFMLHPNAPRSTAAIGDWITARMRTC